MTENELEEIEDNFAVLLLKEEEGCLVQPEAAKKAIILYSTAYRMCNEANESGGKGFPRFEKISKHDNRGRPLILIEEHIQFLLKYVE
ncbi:hypothetical protein INT47_000127 [Mucor saturninus]|uniref:Uncharacterized protein n=1 Tax=Mucor saturninus TaxID=64648 RepID=A0A8H7V9Y6_9FUNG|nr:hypothetical protein INT47_000127 [Mucor saturninus]